MRFFVFIALIFLFSFAPRQKTARWGFFGHKLINRLAVFTLPPEMLGFYKKHIRFITENAVNPDRRRYAVVGEAPKHYIDLDVYGDSAWYKIPHRWDKAVEKYSEDTLMAYGIVPWHINLMKFQLTKAFEERDAIKILRLSADLGHYIGDANVPLHTTQNYNGQFTGQYGIHGFWESRLPELFHEDYNFFADKRAEYIKNPQERAWQAVLEANNALDSVLSFEKELTKKMGEDKKYAFETRLGLTVKTYSSHFSRVYHQSLNGQVERRMKTTIKMVGDFWLTAWIDAGQPNLDLLAGFTPTQQDSLQEKIPFMPLKTREHDN